MTAHDPDYIAGLAAQLDLVAEFRVPCPGHPHGRLADLHVIKRTDGHGDGWAITDGRLGGEQAWTGQRWTYRTELSRDDIYRWTRDAALEEALRIAPGITARIRDHIACPRADKGE